VTVDAGADGDGQAVAINCVGESGGSTTGPQGELVESAPLHDIGQSIGQSMDGIKATGSNGVRVAVSDALDGVSMSSARASASM